MKKETWMLIGGAALGAIALAALSRMNGKSEEAPAEEPQLPAAAAQTQKNAQPYQKAPLVTLAQLAPKDKQIAVQEFSVPRSASQDEAHEKTRELAIQVSRHWPGLRMLLAELEAAGVKAALDPHTSANPPGVFEESEVDRNALARGLAVRFHPSMFHHVQSMSPHASGPGEHAGKVFVDAVGRWFLWKDNGWHEVDFAREHERVLPWDALYTQGGYVSQNTKRSLNSVEHSQWVASEEQKKAQNPDYEPKPVPIFMQQKDGSWTQTVNYDPKAFKGIEEQFPMQLAKGDSDRVVMTIEIMLPGGQTLPAMNGPQEKAQLNITRYFPV